MLGAQVQRRFEVLKKRKDTGGFTEQGKNWKIRVQLIYLPSQVRVHLVFWLSPSFSHTWNGMIIIFPFRPPDPGHYCQFCENKYWNAQYHARILIGKFKVIQSCILRFPQQQLLQLSFLKLKGSIYLSSQGKKFPSPRMFYWQLGNGTSCMITIFQQRLLLSHCQFWEHCNI